MGKKSRLKRERRLIGAEARHSKPSWSAGGAQPFVAPDGREIFVFDCAGGLQSHEQALAEFAADVRAAVADDDASLMAQLASMGSLMGLSIFDVELSVYADGSESELTMDPLPLALVKLKRMDCFRWLICAILEPSRPPLGQAFMTAYAEAIALLVNAIHCDPGYDAPGSLTRRMCEAFARHLLEARPEGMDPLALKAFEVHPTFRGELARFRQEELAISEAAFIEAGISIAPDESPEPIGFGRRPVAGSALRI